MDQMDPEKIDEETLAETPEDVAVLYSWAKLDGAKYRDFSASRREYRAQMRHRAAESQRETERKAQGEAEAAAAATEKAAREAEEIARFHESAARLATGSARRGDSAIEEAAGARATLVAAELARRASAERVEAARRAEAVAAAEAASRREEREMAEAHASAQRQAQRYQESEMRRRAAAGPQPTLGGTISDPYTMENTSVRPDRVYHLPVVPQDDMAPGRFRQSRERNVVVPQPDPENPYASQVDPGHFKAVPQDAGEGGEIEFDMSRRATDRPHPLRRATDMPESVPAGLSAVRDGAGWFYQARHVEDDGRRFSAPRSSGSTPDVAPPRIYEAQAKQDAYADSVSRTRISGSRQSGTGESGSDARPAYESRPEPVERRPLQRMEEIETEDSVPAWINSPQPQQPSQQPVVPRIPQPMSPVEDTLQHSREQVASRWFALKGVFEHGTQEPHHESQVQRAKVMPAPLLTVFSLAGGVGKTSLVATLGRALSSAGERVLLTDTTSHGLLPFYFGASELRPGKVRTFAPPEGSADAPIHLVSYDVSQKTGDAASQNWLAEELAKNSRGMQRVLVDLTPSAAWVARKLARMNSTLLIPVAPDMNSVISLQGVEKFFAGMVDSEGRLVEPFYLLNQFDASLPLHLDVREVMRQQLGDRLLPFAIRRSAGVSEALAEGMTVMDYAPESAVAGDYMNLVSWLRAQVAPAPTEFKTARWSER